MFNVISKLNSSFVDFSQRVSASAESTKKMSEKTQRIALFVLGAALIYGGVIAKAVAQLPEADAEANYDQDRLESAVRVIFGFLEGGFGALIMVCAGIGAILSSAFGQYRAALGMLVVAVGTFILRAFVITWFDVDLG